MTLPPLPKPNVEAYHYDKYQMHDYGRQCREAALAALTKDAERLDHIQVTGATVELVNFGQKPVQHSFRVGGLYKAINFDLRLAIDAAIAAQKGEQV